MEPNVTLITGSNSGIGFAIAASFAQDAEKKYIVYATMRNLGKRGNLEKEVGSALNNTLFIRELDVTKEETIKKVVAELKEKHGRIDILINNAGSGLAMIMEITPLQEMRDVMEVNYFGPMRIMQEVIPIMKQRQSGRIINMSSLSGIFAFTFFEAYAASKFALEGLTEGLAIQLRPHGIWVSSIQPGPIKSSISDNSLFHDEQAEDKRVDAKTRALFTACNQQMKDVLSHRRALPVQKVVDTVYQCLTDKAPHVRYLCSGFFPFETMKYKDDNGDDYVNAVLEMFKGVV